MELSPLYLERLNEATQQGIERGIQQGIERGIQQGIERGIQQGIERGIQQGESIVVENLLRVRFGVLDEELRSIVESLLELPPEEFTLLLLQLSRDELLARFSR